MVYKLKVYRLPLGTPQARGKALVNLLPLEEGETIIDRHAAAGGRGELGRAARHVRHRAAATCAATSCRDFANVKPNGKIAMKLEGEDAATG